MEQVDDMAGGSSQTGVKVFSVTDIPTLLKKRYAAVPNISDYSLGIVRRRVVYYLDLHFVRTDALGKHAAQGFG